MTPRTKEQNEEIRLQRLVQIRKAAADVFLKKGPLLEIRDVAAQAGLGYGTVYHYYSNKGDLLRDLLWDALERAGGWLESPLEAPWKAPLKVPLKTQRKAPLEVPRAPASGEAPAGGHFGLAAAADTGNPAAADSRSGSRAMAAAAELGPVAAAGVRLLHLWAEDHALYLLYKQAGEGFASLPEAHSAPLSAAFRREVLAPLAALLEAGRAGDGAAGSAAEPLYRLQRAEMLLAALVGCAALSLRRGKLHEEAGDIARFLKL
ncbi:TetR/AcrR family transcriptional regulator [Paenibacillus graminis]|uniref:TetR family transcriptional regulator n=2 Tax=Paenibacillus graminis TaxID=189425 RepID=A0A089MF28_9BACL|nr:TetR/AcrR family transcriptional regulator [Paenibacillus graminis]AIQ70093.1 TetR family transcriptional regulator [Paenibacillus graminis]